MRPYLERVGYYHMPVVMDKAKSAPDCAAAREILVSSDTAVFEMRL
jgi:hypothetical protein